MNLGEDVIFIFTLVIICSKIILNVKTCRIRTLETKNRELEQNRSGGFNNNGHGDDMDPDEV